MNRTQDVNVADRKSADARKGAPDRATLRAELQSQDPNQPVIHRYQIACREAHSPWLSHEAWQQQAPRHDGSWWPAWHQWLAAYSSKPVAAVAIPARAALGDAPGQYVMQRYED